MTGSTVAQTYPAKPVRVVVPYPAGGPVDILGRLIAQRLSESLGQPFVVDNRAGASGNIGSEFVAKSAPDGYTLVVGNNATHATNESLYPNLPYATLRDFAPIALVATVTNIVAVYPGLPVTTIPELIAYAKANPGKINYASSGSGSASHLTGEMFKIVTGTDMVHVPYRGSAVALPDLLSGRLAVMFNNLPAAMPYLRAGTLKALAVTAPERWPELPDVPTLDEAGVKGFDVSSWYALMGPANLPRDKVMAINRAVVQGLEAPDVRAKLIEMGTRPATGTPEQLAAFVDREIKRWAPVVKATGLKID